MSTLTHKGLVESAAGSADRRTTLLSLTPAGADAAQAVSQVEQNLYAAFAMILDDNAISAVLPVLRTLVRQLPAGQALQRRITDKDPTN